MSPHMGPEPLDLRDEMLLSRDFPWRDYALCKGMDPGIFFPLHASLNKVAKAVCASCPVQAECLLWCIEAKIGVGIYGGYTNAERQHLMRKTEGLRVALYKMLRDKKIS